MATQLRLEDTDVHLLLHCACGKKFKTTMSYNQINYKTVTVLRRRLFAHTANAPIHPRKMLWADVRKMQPRVWNSDLTKEYSMPDITSRSNSRSRSPRRSRSPSEVREDKLDKVLEHLTSVSEKLDTVSQRLDQRDKL